MSAIQKKFAEILADSGKLVEGGWVGFYAMVYPNGAPPAQTEELRNTFFAGAQHIFAAMMTLMNDEPDPTDQEMSRLTSIHEELQEFLRGFELKNLPAKGSA